MARSFFVSRLDFSRGVDTRASDLSRDPKSVLALVNGRIDKRGIIRVFPGYSQVGSSVGSGDTFVHMHKPISSATRKLLAAADGVVKVYNPGTEAWDTLHTFADTSASIGFATLGDQTIVGNGVNAPVYINAAASTATALPNAPLMDTFKTISQRVFGFNTKATSNRNRVYFSPTPIEGGLPSWDTTDPSFTDNNFDIDAESSLNAAARAKGHLWLMNETSTLRAEGGLPPVHSAADLGAAGRLAATDGIKFAFGLDGQGMWGTPEGDPVVLSRYIDDYIEGINQNTINNAAMGIRNDYVFVAVGDTNAHDRALSLTKGVLLYNLAWDAFSTLSDWNVASFGSWIDGTKYLVFGTRDGRVMRWPSGTSYNGNPIHFRLDTGFDFVNAPHLLKGATTITLFFERGAGATVQYVLFTESGAQSPRPIPVSMDKDVVRFTLPQEEKWYGIKFLITQSTKEAGLSFLGYTLDGYTAGDL